MKSRVLQFGMVCVLALLATAVQADTITLSATQDTYGRNYDGSPNGAENTLWLATSGGGNMSRIFIQFDLSAIPDGRTIESATLRIYRHGVVAGNNSVAMWGAKVTEAWDEDTLYGCDPYSTNNNPALNLGATFIPGVVLDQTTIGWFEWNATDAATSWYAGSNYGVGMIYNNFATTTQNSFYSSNADDYTPELVVTYIPEPATMGLLGIGGLLMLVRRRRRK